MKKFLTLALCLLLICGALFLVACDDGSDTNDGDNGGENSTPHTHTWGEWETVTPATCVDVGEEKRTCGCGAFETQPIPATGIHIYSAWEPITPATCVDAGEEKRTCQCTAFETRPIPATNKHVCDTGNTCTTCGTALPFTEGLSYTSILNNTAYAVSGIGTATTTDIVIPDYYEGLPVTSIDASAFYLCGYNLTSVIIPSTVTSIGNYAFACTALTSVTIPTSVENIGDYAFWQCLDLPSITIPASVTSIGNSAFRECAALETVNFAENSKLISIDVMAFHSCSSLTSIVIPENVTTIKTATFGYCTSLTSIAIPASLTQIDINVFLHCINIETITVDTQNPAYYNTEHCLIETATKTLITCCKNNIIPTDGSITKIGSGVFAGRTNLTTITIPSTVTEIGIFAFNGCSSLISVTIPASVTSIGGYAFYGCENLETVTLAEGSKCTSIGERAFYNCTSLMSFTIPASVTNIGGYAFYGCESLSSIKFRGTESQWGTISKGSNWDLGTPSYTITYNYTGK